MKHKYNAGYTLLETVVAIAILAIIVGPVSTGMVMAFKMNAKTNQLMQAELAVSSAVETLMSKGIDGMEIAEGTFPDVTITTEPVKDGEDTIYYKVTVTSKEATGVKVESCIRAVEPTVPEMTEGDSE